MKSTVFATEIPTAEPRLTLFPVPIHPHKKICYVI